MLRNVADTGPAPAPAGAPTTPGGYIPGLGITPQGLAALNALTKMGGLGEPFGSLLETYYKSPQYLGEAAGATTRGQLGAEIELKPKLEAAIAWAKIAPNLDEYERKATVDRLTKQLEQLGAAATSSKEVVVSLPDGTRSKDTLTNEQILRLNAGKGVPERGIPPSARLSEPYLRPGQAEQETAAAAPQHLGPTDTVVYPPGSIGASTYQSDKMRGRALPDNVSIQPDGSVRVSGGSATVGQIDQTQQDFFKLKDTAATAREGLYKAQLLREQLHQIGTSGPITDTLGAFGALAQQLGVPEATVKQYLSVRPASVEAAEKLSQDLLGEVLKTTFPQRITNADIAAWKNTVPRGTMLQDAYDLLLDKTVMPKFQQAIGRYGSVAHLPATDPQLKTYTQELEKFDKANPLGSFVQPNSTDTGLPAGAVATGQYIRGKPVYRVPGDPKLKVLQ
jgi:hypothetical protein